MASEYAHLCEGGPDKRLVNANITCLFASPRLATPRLATNIY